MDLIEFLVCINFPSQFFIKEDSEIFNRLIFTIMGHLLVFS